MSSPVRKLDPSLIDPEWGTPPKGRPRGRPSLWPRRLAPLVENPGQWALIYRGKLATCYRSAHLIQSGGITLPEGTEAKDWSATARSNPEGKGGVVYACYKDES